MNISKLKIFLFCSIFLFSLGCIKPNSDTFSNTTTSNNYFIRHIGEEIIGTATSTTASQLNSAIKDFFEDDEYGPFNMNYHITSTDHPVDKGTVINDITTISSKLDSNSTLVYFYHAHGSEDGYWTTTKHSRRSISSKDDDDIFPETIITALRKGRQIDPNSEDENADLKPPFKRFIIIAESCYSGQFVELFRQQILERNNQKKPKIFEEGIYLYSSDATEETLGFNAGNILYPILFFLRAQQIETCTSHESTSYNKTYDTIVRPFLTSKRFYQDSINIILKNTSLEKLVASKRFNEKNPTFDDLYRIIENIHNLKLIHFIMNISFSDEYSKQKANIRYNSIFPPINNCN